MTTSGQTDMERAEAALAKVREAWLAREGVTAVDLGFKWSQGQMSGQIAVRVHVSHKKPASALTDAERFPEEIDGVPVDVIEATYGIQLMPEGDTQLEAAAAGRDQRYDEIPLGVSIGSPTVTAGTLGAKVIDAETGAECILSNWHVLVGILDAQPGTSVWQPGRLDGGQENDRIAEVIRSVLGPFDAALARITGERHILDTTLEGELITGTTSPRLGMLVWKNGRTTGRTQGFIDGVQMTTRLTYSSAGPRQLEMVFRIVPRPGAAPAEISLGGDSGSIWIDEESGKAVGLHFAGELGEAPEYALAHDITAVAAQLGFVFPGDRLPAEPAPTSPAIPLATTTPVPTTSLLDRLRQWLKALFSRA